MPRISRHANGAHAAPHRWETLSSRKRSPLSARRWPSGVFSSSSLLYRAIAATLGLGSLFAALWIGWLVPAQSWNRATGWHAIPPQEQAPLSTVWPPFGDDFSLHWLGHGGFRIAWQGTILLLDPNLSSYCTVVPRRLQLPERAHELGPIDAVLISHAHFDHLDLPTLERIPKPQTIIVPDGAGPYVKDLAAWTTLQELSIGRSIKLGELEIIAVDAAHNGNRLHPFSAREDAVGYVIRSPRGTLYIAGDTGFGASQGETESSLFTSIRNEFKPDVAILPIGAYAPRTVLAPYHLSPEEAVAAAETLRVDAVFPSHFGTFTLSWDQPSWALPRFAKEAHLKGLTWHMPVLWDGMPETENLSIQSSIGGNP